LEPFIRFTAVRRPFVTNLPALDLFPTALWARVAARRVRRASIRDLTGCDVSGYRPLREVVADYLRRSRGVNCVTEQVVIVSGVQEALAMVARLLVSPGERVLMEEPGYPGALRAFAAAGARVGFVPVDHAGMTIPPQSGAPRFVYVTPAHQFPLGTTMAYARRLARSSAARRCDLLSWRRPRCPLTFLSCPSSGPPSARSAIHHFVSAAANLVHEMLRQIGDDLTTCFPRGARAGIEWMRNLAIRRSPHG
ncbi:MAG TPA: aminotransferase class I/II-fold pyridoxal phosphate-dependent enzyme, partial [Vicinamibacterales bacterium]|nr:aminotransferase class I/II-fold pyridoxal phosphate-dependent enzyme [Vicinamibacterales bacterium]